MFALKRRWLLFAGALLIGGTAVVQGIVGSRADEAGPDAVAAVVTRASTADTTAAGQRAAGLAALAKADEVVIERGKLAMPDASASEQAELPGFADALARKVPAAERLQRREVLTRGTQVASDAASVLSRRESRTRYRQRSRTQARELAEAAFPDYMGRSPPQPLELEADEKVASFRGPFAAVVEDSGDGGTRAGRYLAVSSLPLRSPVNSGEMAPVDMTLRETGTTVQPVNPLSEISIPKDITVPARVGRGYALCAKVFGGNFYRRQA